MSGLTKDVALATIVVGAVIAMSLALTVLFTPLVQPPVTDWREPPWFPPGTME